MVFLRPLSTIFHPPTSFLSQIGYKGDSIGTGQVIIVIIEILVIAGICAFGLFLAFVIVVSVLEVMKTALKLLIGVVQVGSFFGCGRFAYDQFKSREAKKAEVVQTVKPVVKSFKVNKRKSPR